MVTARHSPGLTALVFALAACAGVARADDHAHHGGPVADHVARTAEAVKTHHAKVSDAVSGVADHMAETRAKMRAARDAHVERAVSHATDAHARFTSAMTAAIKAMGDAAQAWHDHVQETTTKVRDAKADARQAAMTRAADAVDAHRERTANVMSKEAAHHDNKGDDTRRRLLDAHDEHDEPADTRASDTSDHSDTDHHSHARDTDHHSHARMTHRDASSSRHSKTWSSHADMVRESRERWADWAQSKMERRQSSRAAALEHVADAIDARKERKEKMRTAVVDHFTKN